MTYNVFLGTLNLAQPICYVKCLKLDSASYVQSSDGKNYFKISVTTTAFKLTL